MKYPVWSIVLIMPIAVLLIAQPSSAAYESVLVIAEGIAPVIDGNIVLAKADARRDSYRRAIEQGIGVEIIAETQMEMLEIVSDLVITKAQGYVRSHRFLEEWVDEDEVYHIKIEAEVQKGDIHDDLTGLKILIDYIIGNPTVMIVFQEKNLGEIPLFSVAQVKMSEIFSSVGYHLVDERQMQIIQEDEIIQKVMAGDRDAAITMADRFKADIIIAGQVTTEEFSISQTAASNLATVQATASVKAIVARTGQVIVAKQSIGKAVHFSAKNAGNQAITKCISDTTNKLIYEIPTKLFEARTVKVIVKNCTYSQRKRLLGAFQNIASVSRAYSRTYEHSTATFDVKTRDSSESLADHLDALDLPNLNIITVNAAQVIAEIVPEEERKE
ncbi:hypothetical protein ACFL6S_35340 [Candidatus Poribacteria bacterium]